MRLLADLLFTEPAVCTFYQKGMCKYGKGCKFAHIRVSSNGNSHDSADWRTATKTDPFQMAPLAKSDNDFMTGNSGAAAINPDFTVLPREGSVPTNKIPVNAREERLDCYHGPIKAEDRAQFRARITKQKLCNGYHLNRHCPNGATCPVSIISHLLTSVTRQASYMENADRGVSILLEAYADYCPVRPLPYRRGSQGMSPRSRPPRTVSTSSGLPFPQLSLRTCLPTIRLPKARRQGLLQVPDAHA